MACFTPRFVDEGPLLIAGLRESHPGTVAGIPAQWLRFAPYIGRIPGEIEGAAYGVCLGGEGADGFDYVAGVAVSGIGPLPAGLSPLCLPASSYAVFEHAGHVSALAETVDAILTRWLPGSGRTPARVPTFFERYGETFDPLTGLGGLEVWVPLAD